jgi:hypothetical protein
MKNVRFTLTVTTLLVGLFLVNSAWASSPATLKVKIPFSFYAAEKQMPAGQYFLTQNDGGRTLTVQRIDGSEYTTVLVMPQRKTGVAQEDTLVFHQYGSDYFLRGISSVHSTIGGYLPKSKREGNLATELAKKQGQETPAQVVLNRNAE